MSVPPSARAAVNQGRIDIAAALRWAAHLGLNEGVCNHFSLAVPGLPDRFLLNPQGIHWAEITAADIVLVDSDGNLVEGRHRIEPTAFFIHSCVHRASPRAACVLHTHMSYALALCLLQDGRLEWCEQNALRFHGRVAYDEDYGGVALAADEGKRIAAKLGSADVLFLASHGVIVCGPNVAWAFDDLYILERACKAQVLARSTGGRLRTIPPEVCAATARQIAGERQQSDLFFAAIKRLLDRDQPGWSALE